MKGTLSQAALILFGLAICLGGCQSGEPQATAEQKKAFGGSAPPKDYMSNIPKNAPANPAPSGPAPGN